jgi:glyceraldehyde-3-phosphate dehydrogenase/erythrose-4-phosphate dehydrogenase
MPDRRLRVLFLCTGYPELLGKLTGIAVRVRLLNASLTDCVFEVQRPTSVEEVNAAFKRAAAGMLHGILGYEKRPLVSVDFKDDTRSAIVHRRCALDHGRGRHMCQGPGVV